MSYLCVLFCAYWFCREIKLFSLKINQQVYQDYQQLYPHNLSLSEFNRYSTLQPKNSYFSYCFYFLYPCVIFLFSEQSIYIKLTVLILIYLSLLDYHYYLTDSRYIVVIFLLGVTELLFEYPDRINEFLWIFWLLSIFFGIFLPLSNYFMKRDALGLGDVWLLLALTPFFSLDQMIFMILFACLSGLVFGLGYFGYYRYKIHRLPFIPFITFSTFYVFLVKLP